MSNPKRGDKYLNILTATTTVVKTGAGTVKRIVMGKAVASGVITVYDHASGAGDIILKITHPGTLLQNQYCLEINAKFTLGLTIITGSTDDFTVVYNDT